MSTTDNFTKGKMSRMLHLFGRYYL
jgi:hypothetical protein